MNALPAAARFDHAAHAAPRIRDLLPLYMDALGGRFLYGDTNEEVGFRAVQIEYGGGTKIELIEATEGSGFLDGFLRRNPAGGLHHVTYRVPDLDAAIAMAERAGFAVFGVNTERPEWKEAFIHPRAAHGVLVQLAQTAPEWPPKTSGASLESILGPA